MHHFKLLVPLGSSHIFLSLFPLHLLFSLILPTQSLQRCRVLKPPLFHDFLIIYFLLPFLFYSLLLLLVYAVLHERFVLLVLLFINRLKLVGMLRMSFFSFFWSHLEILWLDNIVLKVDIFRQIEVKLWQLVGLELV